jgi:hypothetical protein
MKREELAAVVWILGVLLAGMAAVVAGRRRGARRG